MTTNTTTIANTTTESSSLILYGNAYDNFVNTIKSEHTLEHYQYAIKKFMQYLKITVYYGTKEEYITFCTPEAANAIDIYLKYRERCGEILTEKSPLFR